MSGFITFLVYFLIIVVVISRIKKVKNKDQVQKKPVTTHANTSASNVPNIYKKKPKASGVNAHMSKEKGNDYKWEDRRHDWLADQMADERQAQKRMSEMFQLKLEHRYNCEAEMLKQFHESHCDADSVDSAKPQ